MDTIETVYDRSGREMLAADGAEARWMQENPVAGGILHESRQLIARFKDMALPWISKALALVDRDDIVPRVAEIPLKPQYGGIGRRAMRPGTTRATLRRMQRDEAMVASVGYILAQSEPFQRIVRRGMVDFYAFHLQAVASMWDRRVDGRVTVQITKAERMELVRSLVIGESLDALVDRSLRKLADAVRLAPVKGVFALTRTKTGIAKAVRDRADHAVKTARRELQLVAEEFLFLAARKGLGQIPRFTAGGHRRGS